MHPILYKRRQSELTGLYAGQSIKEGLLLMGNWFLVVFWKGLNINREISISLKVKEERSI